MGKKLSHKDNCGVEWDSAGRKQNVVRSIFFIFAKVTVVK